MKKFHLLSKSILLICFVFLSFCSFSQAVTLTASSGTATGSFTTLKLAFDAINLGTHKGDIVISINANITETASASLTASTGVTTTAPFYTSVTIYPTTTGLSITGNLAAPLINLNGADNVTIDGRVNATGTTNSLTITNTSAVATAGTSTIRFIADASNNSVQYCNIKGSSTDAASGIIFFSTATTTGNDNNNISNNNITCATDASRPLNAVYALGTTAKINNNDSISNNNFFNFLSKSTASQAINISSFNTVFIISDNSFYETASFTASAAVNYTAILISAATGTENGFKILNNYIGGTAAQCGGTAWTKTAQNNAFAAISVNTAAGTATEIQGNTIQNFNWTNAGTSDFTGISIAGVTVANIGTTTGNTIGAATGTASITFTSNTTATDFFGISLGSTGAVNCQNNTIGAITVANAATNASNFYGIVKTAVAGTTTISNNSIGSATTANSINASSASSTAANIQSVYGIQSAGIGSITIDGNTIANMINATTNATAASAGAISGIYVSGGTNTISNNVVSDLSIANANTSITNTASVSGIVMAGTAAAQTVSGNTIYNLVNSNASFAGGVIGIYYNGSTIVSNIKANFIHSLSVSGASSIAADLYGIKIDGGASTYSNNIISLGGTTKTDLYGIYQTNGAATGIQSIYYNTVYIAGSMVTGATNLSYALYSTGIANARNFKNNIFVNTRSTVAGVSKHFALYIVASGGTIACNNNNYYVSGTGTVLGFFGANKTALPIVTGFDLNSIATNPAFSNAGGTTASNYTPTLAGVAETGTGITVDYTGSTRGNPVTMGAFELKLGAAAPTDVVATAGVISASIAFTAPTELGGGAITDYQYSLDNGASWTAVGQTTSPFSIFGLTECNTYNIKIRAINISGGGTPATVSVTPPKGQVAHIWTVRSTPADNNWSAVTYGEGLFVAVGQSGTGNRVMTSPDGITWTSRTSAANNQWVDVTYGEGIFVAVAVTGLGNRVMTSLNGTSWTIRTTPADNSWNSVTYGNGIFVAVANTGTGNRVMTSLDGTTWTIRTSAADNDWTSVTFGNGTFVAVANTGTGNRVMTSLNGTSWTIRNSAQNSAWLAVTYGNGQFVAVANSGTNTVMTSPNGTTWTIRAETRGMYDVTYGNGHFVATSTGNQIYTSPDGITWSAKTTPNGHVAESITYGNAKFVTVTVLGTTGNRAMSSDDVLAPGNPTISSITPTYNAASVAFTAPASSGSSAITNYEYSVDNGSTWVTPSPVVTTSPLSITGLTPGTVYNIQIRAVNTAAGAGCASATVTTTTIIPVVTNEPTNVVATAGVNAAIISFTAPSNDGGAAITDYQYTIDNGGSWTAIGNSSSPIYIENLTACTNYTIKIRAINYAGGGTASAAVAVTPQKGQVATIWTARTTPADLSWSEVTYGKGLFVAVAYSGFGNRVMTSPDGITWTSRTSATDNEWTGVTYGNGLFIAVAQTGTGNRVMTSPDGITWTSRTSAANNNWQSVTYGNGLFVAVASTISGTGVMTSPDGITWTARMPAAPNQWLSVTYGNGTFVAVTNTGTGNRVMTSSDGITWTSRTSAEDNSWASVTYGNGQFVAVSFSFGTNNVMTSPDGITWTIRTQLTNSMACITYGNGIFVARGSSNQVYKSSDGITWFANIAATSNPSSSITYGNGKFVSISNFGTGNRAETSADALAPTSPTITGITAASTSASVAFTAPTSIGSSAITNYEYSINNGTTWVIPGPAVTTSPLSINNLTPGTAYNIQIRAVNTAAGAGCGSATMSTTTSSVVLSVNFISITASRKTTNVQVNWKVGNEINIDHYEVERSVDGRNYSRVGNVAATAVADYSFLDVNAPTTNIFYRIKSVENAGESKYSAIAKLYAEKTTPGYAVAPNPIVGTEINVHFKNQLAGKYQLKLFNNAGQQIQRTEVNHTGGNGTQTLQIPAGLAGGAYQLEIISAGKTSSMVSILINN